MYLIMYSNQGIVNWRLHKEVTKSTALPTV